MPNSWVVGSWLTKRQLYKVCSSKIRTRSVLAFNRTTSPNDDDKPPGSDALNSWHMEVGANDESFSTDPYIILYSAGGLVLVIIRLLIGEPQARNPARKDATCYLCLWAAAFAACVVWSLVRGHVQSCRIQAITACLVPFGGRRMDYGWMDRMVTH
jgi:hypothetical protein